MVDLIFSPDYMTVRSWPTTHGHGDKPKMPIQIAAFMQSFVTRHVQDKMDPKLFMTRCVYILNSVRELPDHVRTPSFY